MKRKLNVFVVALLVVVGGLLWTIGRVRRAATPPPTVITIVMPTAGSVVAPVAAQSTPVPVVSTPKQDAVPAPSPVELPVAEAVVPPTKANEPSSAVAVDPTPAAAAHELKYNARPGDTVSTLAGALLGSNTKENRDAIVDANASLQADPDHLVADKTYHIPVRAGQSLAAAPDADVATARPATQPDADAVVQAGSGRELRYVAQPGDTVGSLATALLGSDTTRNTAAIINSNASLRQNPDRVIAGKTYWIPAPAAPQPN